MDNLEQDPEEIPMDQVLAGIRQMLSPQTETQEEKQAFKLVLSPTQESAAFENPLPPISEKVKSPGDDYFLLTPAMRCDLPPDSELSEAVQKQTTRVLNKLQQQSTSELSPALMEWLNAHLPDMIEKELEKRSKVGE